MRIYFDRNIYNMARDQGCVDILAQFLQSKSLLLPFSGHIMQEIDGISDGQLRKAAYKDVGILANDFISDPALIICQEFVAELRRLKPDWLSPYVTVNLTDSVQEYRKQLWLDLRNGGTDRADLRRQGDRFRAESKKSANEAQRYFRDSLRGQPFVIFTKSSGEKTSEYQMDTRDNQWREDCVVFWHEALIGRNPAYRDIIGFTSPLVNSEALRDVDSLAKFWR